MSLRVIGAGFGRTGTSSLKFALETLGYGPCHHMVEVIKDPEQQRVWRGIAAGEQPDWNRAFKGFESSVDWPSAHYWRELAQHYPEAKIILSVRPSEDWFASMEKTIFGVVDRSTDESSLALALIKNNVFAAGDVHDRDFAISVFERNTTEVQRAFGPDRLLTYRIGEGWEPLCTFLGQPIPETPYPRRNSAAEFNAPRG